MISFTEPLVKRKFNQAYDYILENHEKKYKDALSQRKPNDSEFISLMYVSVWKELKEFYTNAELFDRRTEFSREYVDDLLLDEEIYKSDIKYHLHNSLRFVWEYHLSIHSTTTPLGKICFDSEKIRYLDSINEITWNVASGGYTPAFSWIVDIMPYDIYRQFIASSDFQKARSLTSDIDLEKAKLKNEVENIILQAGSSIEYLDNVRQEAKDLGERLTNIKREGNFKLLAKAFSTLRTGKSSEVVYAQLRMWTFVAFLILLPMFSFWHFQQKLNNPDFFTLVKYIPLISLEILFFYFMRLFYIEVKSLKSQLVQIDLRLNLCEFIYDYIETRGKTHSDKVNDSWKAFESLIFSPIQPNEDKIPSVMDGTDVLADLAGKILKARQ
ncbi:hypothetical protein DAI21_10135 [Lelliottia sp. WB101]|uniref:hypothetical protein n=1 Tax=Lelliottia sp. WB101 TaxID=2153385 RepID=UPI000D22A3C5|nr:hypothetical protein [Lelliottia sp. WB101]AVY97991.1 hypothetical protein DAI21_10135 [Lelliottia sp. WB101]